jgi:hypothetical protein
LNRTWRSETPFHSRSDGTVDFSVNRSAVESMQPFWSLRLGPETPPADRSSPRFETPAAGGFDVRLEVLDGERVIASATARRLVTLSDVRVSEVREKGLVGRLYEPETLGRHAALLVLTGSNGGVPFHHAGLLASKGYVAFALAYFRVEPLPQDTSKSQSNISRRLSPG